MSNCATTTASAARLGRPCQAAFRRAQIVRSDARIRPCGETSANGFAEAGVDGDRRLTTTLLDHGLDRAGDGRQSRAPTRRRTDGALGTLLGTGSCGSCRPGVRSHAEGAALVEVERDLFSQVDSVLSLLGEVRPATAFDASTRRDDRLSMPTSPGRTGRTSDEPTAGPAAAAAHAHRAYR